MSQKRDVVLCLLDLSSVFGTLHHGILIKRLPEIGIETMHWNCFGHTLKVEPHPLKVNKSRSSLTG